MRRWLTNLQEFNKLEDRNRLLTLVRYATYAPSSHNTQPWLFRVGQNSIEVLPNRHRKLSASDIDDRQFYISIGTAAYNIEISARELGLDFEVTVIKSNDDATVKFNFYSLTAKKYENNILESIILRENNRTLFSKQKIEQNLLKRFSDSLKAEFPEIELFFFDYDPVKTELIKIFSNALEDAFADKKFTNELSKWLKPSLRKYPDGMPGYNLGVPWVLSFLLPWMVKNINVTSQQVKMNTELLKSAAVLGIIATTDDNQAGWIKVGQALESFFLESTRHGLKMSLFTAPIEIGSYNLEIKKVAKTKGRPHVLFRLGYTDNTTPSSPRLPVESVLTD